jgi:hypothetical protein
LKNLAYDDEGQQNVLICNSERYYQSEREANCLGAQWPAPGLLMVGY